MVKTKKETPSFKVGTKVKITRLEKGFIDEGEVISSSDKLVIKITKSKTPEIEGKEILFGFRDGVWKYLNGNSYSQRDPGYSIVEK